MPRPSVTKRLRARLHRKLRYGDQAALAKFSQERPGGSGITQTDLSNFLGAHPNRRGLTIDDLDDIAAFFNTTVGELLGDTRLGDLSAEEQRLVQAFRLLPHKQQLEVVDVVEFMGLAAREGRRFSAPNRPLPRPLPESA